jgi:hypothetical protein
MGGGGGGHTTSTVHQSSLPEYAKPYYTSLMRRGQEESFRPYEPYEGQRLAGMSGTTSAGLGMAKNYARSGLGALPGAQNIANQTSQEAMGMTGYESGYGGPAGYQAGQFSADDVSADNIGVGMFDSAIANQYMSPYMADVTQRAKLDVMKNTMEEQIYRNSEAAKSGAFGGSRAAVQNQMAIGQAQDRMMDLDVQGRQAAFENAQQQFERDRAARFGADRANQEANLQADLSNQDAGLEAQQLGEQSRQFGYSTDEQARQRAEELRQSGRQSNLQAIEAAQRGSGIMADLQNRRDQMVLNRVKAQLGAGQTEEEYLQEQLDMGYQDFVNQRDANRQNLQFVSSLLQGVPISANQDIATTTPTNNLAGGVGTLAGLQALYQLGNT